MLNNIKKRIKQTIIYEYYLYFKVKKIVKNNTVKSNNSNLNQYIYVMLEPDHDNIGDQGIAYAQQKFVEDNFKEYNKVFVLERDYIRYKNIWKKVINKNDIIMLHGGGNFGNQYMHHENTRRDVIKNFKENKIVLFPQTIHFTDDKIGYKELQNSIEIYSAHNNLTLIAREEKSFETMKKIFINNNIILTPDIVLYLNKLEPKLKREKIVICFRDDEEAILENKEKEDIINICKKYSENIEITDMRARKTIDREERNNILNNKFNQFKSAKIVITDRLHGMIFAAVSGTPCIVFSNYNHKVKGTYKWIEHLDYIKFATNINNVEDYIKELKNINNTKYTNEYAIKYYKQIIELIKS